MSISAPSHAESDDPVTITGPSGSLTVQAAVSVGHTKTVMATKHPVERGFSIVDHLRPEPPVVTIEGVVSNLPPSGQDGDVDTAYAFLGNLFANPELVTVVTTKETYESMAMTSDSVTEKAANGESLEFNLSFLFIRVVDPKRTISNVAMGARKKTGKAPEPPKTPVRNKTDLKKLADKARGKAN